MASSANTFGTFLQTFGELEKQRNTSAERFSTTPSLKDVVGVVHDIGKSGDRLFLKDLIDQSGNAKDKVLSAVISGKDQGLIELSEDQGEAIASLTALGRLFAAE